MKPLTLLFTVMTSIMAAQSPLTLYNFDRQIDPRDWIIINDGVMGGRSSSDITVNSDGHGAFCGHVSLANNGGFASVRLRLVDLQVSQYRLVCLRVKSKPGRYQLRCRSASDEPQSYVAWFETDGSWQEVRIPMRSMIPTFRGRRLELPTYPGERLAEVGILVGNKKEEDFCLEIDRVWLEE